MLFLDLFIFLPIFAIRINICTSRTSHPLFAYFQWHFLIWYLWISSDICNKEYLRIFTNIWNRDYQMFVEHLTCMTCIFWPFDIFASFLTHPYIHQFLQNGLAVVSLALVAATRYLHISSCISLFYIFGSLRIFAIGNICLFSPDMLRTCACHPPFAYFHRELLWRLGAFATTRKPRDPLLIKIMAPGTLQENKTKIMEINHVRDFVMWYDIYIIFSITLPLCYSTCPYSPICATNRQQKVTGGRVCICLKEVCAGG